MKTIMNACVGLSLVITLTIVPLTAQETGEHRFTANVGAGFTTPVYGTGSRLDTGWNIVGGAGVNIVPHIGIRAEFMYTEMGVNSATLSALQFPGGDTQIWSRDRESRDPFSPAWRHGFLSHRRTWSLPPACRVHATHRGYVHGI